MTPILHRKLDFLRHFGDCLSYFRVEQIQKSLSELYLDTVALFSCTRFVFLRMVIKTHTFSIYCPSAWRSSLNWPMQFLIVYRTDNKIFESPYYRNFRYCQKIAYSHIHSNDKCGINLQSARRSPNYHQLSK